MIFSDLVMHVDTISLCLKFYDENKEHEITLILMNRDYNKCYILDDLYVNAIYPARLMPNMLYVDFRISLFNFLSKIIDYHGIKERYELKRLLNDNGLEIDYLDNSELKFFNSTLDTIFNDR